MKLSERIPHKAGCGIFSVCICDCYVKELAQLEEKNESLRKLAYDYIQAYEKLAFADALITTEEQGTDVLCFCRHTYLRNIGDICAECGDFMGTDAEEQEDE